MDIDVLMEMLDWNSPEDVQAEGIRLARKVKCIAAFMQPYSNYNLWKNCAIVLSERSDEELRPYMSRLLMWLEDINWPGAFTILKRLQVYQDKEDLKNSIDYYSGYARASVCPECWLMALNEILHPTELSADSDDE